MSLSSFYTSLTTMSLYVYLVLRSLTPKPSSIIDLKKSTHFSKASLAPILTPLPPLKEPLCIPVNFFQTLTSISVKEKKKKCIEFITEFNRTTLHPRFTNIFLQYAILVDTTLPIGYQFLSFL